MARRTGVVVAFGVLGLLAVGALASFAIADGRAAASTPGGCWKLRGARRLGAGRKRQFEARLVTAGSAVNYKLTYSGSRARSPRPTSTSGSTSPTAGSRPGSAARARPSPQARGDHGLPDPGRRGRSRIVRGQMPTSLGRRRPANRRRRVRRDTGADARGLTYANVHSTTDPRRRDPRSDRRGGGGRRRRRDGTA